MALFRRRPRPAAVDQAVQIHLEAPAAAGRHEVTARRVLQRCVSVAMLSGKGGVGKTTTAINLAASLAELGLSVLAVDCDPPYDLTSGPGILPHALRPTL